MAFYLEKQKNYAGLGLRLVKSLEQKLKPKHKGVLGLSTYSRKFYKLFNYDRIAILDHFYIKNQKIACFKIANFHKLKKNQTLLLYMKLRLSLFLNFKNLI